VAAHEAVSAREELFRQLTEALPVGVLQLDDDRRVVFANGRLHDILGVATITTWNDALAHFREADRVALARSLADAIEHQESRDLELRVRSTTTASGRVCQFTLRPLTGGVGSGGVIVCVSDVTDGARLRDELRKRATYDSLTGCHNRSSVIRELERRGYTVWRVGGFAAIDQGRSQMATDALRAGARADT
jgi:PAS domain-containing protein